MDELFLPVLSHFQNANPWTGSLARLRYRVRPTLGQDGVEGVLTAEVWEGPWAYEFSTVEAVKEFPLSEEGLAALPGWLSGWAETVNARPSRTLEENIARKAGPA